jgi:Tat protein translocase TatB subunit
MNLGFSEIAFLVLIALVLFGPRRLPQIAREMGKFMAEFKRASGEFQSQIQQEISKLELEETAKGVAAGVDMSQEHDSIAGTINRLTERIKTLPQDFDA